MNWKKIGLVCLVIMIAVCLAAPAAFAKKKKMNPKSSTAKKDFTDMYDFVVGGDLGANVFGFIPYASVDYDIPVQQADGSIETTTEEGSFYGVGGFGPTIGGHFHLLFHSYIIRAELGYGYQSGSGTYKFDDEDGNEVEEDFTYGMNDLKIGVGFGRTLMKHKKVHPYLVGVVDYHYLTFKDEDMDESASGSGFGAGAIVGIDVKVKKHYWVGGGLRGDLIYSVNPLTLEDNGIETAISMGYVPISIFISGGYMGTF